MQQAHAHDGCDDRAVIALRAAKQRSIDACAEAMAEEIRQTNAVIAAELGRRRAAHIHRIEAYRSLLNTRRLLADECGRVYREWHTSAQVAIAALQIFVALVASIHTAVSTFLTSVNVTSGDDVAISEGNLVVTLIIIVAATSGSFLTGYVEISGWKSSASALATSAAKCSFVEAQLARAIVDARACCTLPDFETAEREFNNRELDQIIAATEYFDGACNPREATKALPTILRRTNQLQAAIVAHESALQAMLREELLRAQSNAAPVLAAQ